MPFDSFADGGNQVRDRRRRRGRAAGVTGRSAEAAVERLYARAGWHALARNWRPGRAYGGGEIDLIMRRGGTVAFVEVKARRSLEEAAHALRPDQLSRLEAAAMRFAELAEVGSLDLRFDLALCDRQGRTQVLANAFA